MCLPVAPDEAWAGRMSANEGLLSTYCVPGTKDITLEHTVSALMELRVLREEGDVSWIITKAHVCGLGSMPTWPGPLPLLLLHSVLLRGLPVPIPCGRDAGIPALSTWHLVKCQLSLQLCTPSRPSPVLVSSGQPLPVSMRQRATSQYLLLLTVGKRIPSVTNAFPGIEVTHLLRLCVPSDRGLLRSGPALPGTG